MAILLTSNIISCLHSVHFKFSAEYKTKLFSIGSFMGTTNSFFFASAKRRVDVNAEEIHNKKRCIIPCTDNEMYSCNSYLSWVISNDNSYVLCDNYQNKFMNSEISYQESFDNNPTDLLCKHCPLVDVKLYNEMANIINYNDYYPEIMLRNRPLALDWLMEISYNYDLQRESYYIAKDIFDRYCQLENKQKKISVQLLCVTCIYIASKFHEFGNLGVEDLIELVDNKIKKQNIYETELYLLHIIEWKVKIWTENKLLLVLMHQRILSDDTIVNCLQLLDLVSLDYNFLYYSTKDICEACIFLVTRNDVPLRSLTGCYRLMYKYWINMKTKCTFNDYFCRNKLTDCNFYSHLCLKFVYKEDMLTIYNSLK